MADTNAMVPAEDLNKLKATFQQKETEAKRQVDELTAKLKEMQEELEAAKDISGLPPSDKRRLTIREQEIAELEKQLKAERYEMTLERTASTRGLDKSELLKRVETLKEGERSLVVIEALADSMKLSKEIEQLKGKATNQPNASANSNPPRNPAPVTGQVNVVALKDIKFDPRGGHVKQMQEALKKG